MRFTKWLGLAVLSATLGTANAQTFNLYAAASLKESVAEIARLFERRYPNFKVAVTLAGSQQLAAQIRHGAPADVFLSAGIEPLNGLSYEPGSLRFFAYNSLAIVVPIGDRRLRTLSDLPRVDRIIVADRSVPVGAYTEEMLGKAAKVQGSLWLGGVNRRIVSREHDVRAVLAKVSLGEADAGIVYTTDGLAGGAKVRMIPIPEAVNIEASYPAVRFANSPNADLAKDFTRFLFERDAQKTLVNHGFSSPIIPGSSIQVSFFGKHTLLSSRKIHLLPLRTFSASEHGVMKSFHGYDLLPSIESARHGRPGRSVKLTAGDGYSQTLPLSEVSADGIFLVDSAHDNFQVIIPSKPPKFWVHWIREIVVQ